MAQFTVRYLESLKPKTQPYFVGEGKKARSGLYVRVAPSGRKSFYLIYSLDGKRRNFCLGGYDLSLSEARESLSEAKKLVSKGIHPGDQRRQDRAVRSTRPTIKELASEFIEKHCKPNRRSWQEDKRVLDTLVIPIWGKRYANDISRRDVRLFLEDIGTERGEVTSNRCHGLLSVMFNFAVDREAIPANPIAGLRRIYKETPRDRFLSFDEIHSFWTALGKSLHFSPEVKNALRLILITGARSGEVVGMKWEELERDNGSKGYWWNMPRQRTKGGRAHRTFLTPLALSYIGDPQVNKGGFVFPSSSGVGHLTTRALSRAVRRQGYLGIEKFTPHDLRRTAASGMAATSVLRFIVERVMGHSDKSITGIYDRYSYDKEKREALTKWSRELKRISAGLEVIDGGADKLEA